MKLLTAIVASAAITLIPSIAQANPLANREVILQTFCSFPTLALNGAVDDCVEVAFESISKGYDIYAIKRNTDRFTARAVNLDVLVVSANTEGNIQEFVARNNR
jgi:hypothetical protein